MKVHHAGKMGDLIYALPVLRALHRTTGEKIHLTTSGMCWQLVPLLWEQPYLADVVTDETRPYSIPPGGVTTNWEFYAAGEGINLSLQPKHYLNDCPINWTLAYAWIAGVEVLPVDYVGLPSLVNHRNWHHQVEVAYDGIPQTMPNTVVVAPEVESLEPASPETWQHIINALMGQGFDVVMVGKSRTYDYAFQMPDSHLSPFHDLRGLTTVPAMARLIAEAQGFIGAHSFPWHLARQARTPAVCLQGWREGLRRCVPIDTTPDRAPWVEPQDWRAAVDWIRARTAVPQPVGGEPHGLD